MSDKIDLVSAYGDGYYDGFLEAKKISKNGDLDDYNEQDILRLSEVAESTDAKKYQWKKPEDVKPTNEKAFYWVRNSSGQVRICYLNDYSKLGWRSDCWQTLGGDDVEMSGTHYIEILEPEFI
ncbi:hypothetical protein [Catenovulum sediminis]|uniref:Uncharacterized protein n=1 Tax=Catenovulum sediminis TaxID=1740262 RepID=A0ABV1RKD0_9ALTE